ncbi:HAMP domain-containing histidine kinase [Sphingobacterium sp. lm-10]|uniref:sensor histidine kinase n=1 Tax=Sphingobacterium sp. lm-10 TaxID=2944904 RepID=UPI002020541A|nr:HAMP domain-containing sensor histidine kinase [Sphingobacterium sp. lm-10]MCL7988118.1 HAMP domain-containing histidine kinase [Sphingobacterium sp. lm-10]
MKFTSIYLVYKIAAVFSFITLISLLVYLTYNTFILNDQQYQNTEKLLIKEFYSNAIRNDKLYPGGQNIFDAHINPKLNLLDSLESHHKRELEDTVATLLHNLELDLKANNTMDSVFEQIKTTFQLGNDWEYALVVNRVRVNLTGDRKVDIYSPEPITAGDRSTIPSMKGFRIGGELKQLRKQNVVSEINVSSTQDFSYQVSFALFADRKNRTIALLQLIAPVFLLGIFAIITIILIYLATYRNWIRQKRLADMKSDFINSITHEFNTPIATIQVANKTLKSQPMIQENKPLLSLTDVIQRQSSRLQRLFAQVLDITSMSGYALQKEPTNIGNLLQEMVDDYRLKTSDCAVDIEFSDFTNQESTAMMNPFFFTTMISNLMENAEKHNHKNSKSIKVGLSDNGNYWRIHLSDNGEGIADKELKLVFQKFYRSASNTKSGLGLGLYYVRQCVIAHGWSIEVESVLEVGSKFVIDIPKNS